MKQTIIPTLLIFICLPITAYAAGEWWDNSGKNEWFEEGEAWKEAEVTIPPYPQQENLLEFTVDNPATQHHQYFLDTRSLSIADDYVVRYSVAIQTRSGATNVFYDGLRCTVREYKNYAFGVNGEFMLNESATWKAIKGGDFFRKALLKGMVCDRITDSPKSVAEIIDQIKYNR
ncbi:MAG: hypothetical protein HON68_02990 [Gammaproteobacteria bacterium]|nr:hypothetical protein [Gammaproteobacteria bacterium]MBT3490232.1 hypothetical protein [Gammaproteobacteria bacterium]MBT3719825.1 hypothetical protein [Gammaproteobacteria bacterium]MBT3845673.1 hypothetical protein [Gammaproteobacteria bacterium]MBT3893112.1 hypothetical protein [Gammaproteobacteria bacterium]